MKKIFIYLFSVLALLSANAFGGVKSLSAESKTTVRDGVFSKSVLVTCTAKKRKFSIQQNEGEKQWCSSDFSLVCHIDKIKVANRICSLKGTAIAKAEHEKIENIEKNKFNQQRKIELTAQLLSIDEQRLIIRQKLLELKKKKIALLNGVVVGKK
jgi:hypothetical protein